MGVGPPLASVSGVLPGISLLKPYAIATSSTMSTECRMSLLVGGTVTSTVPFSSPWYSAGPSCILFSSSQMVPGVMSTPTIEVISLTLASALRVLRRGVVSVATKAVSAASPNCRTPSLPSSYTTVTGSTVKGDPQYSLNMVTTVSSTMCALVRSVAVHSMNTSVVSRVMREWWPLMMGGRDMTVPLPSRITGYRGESLIKGT
mmetsp:Transcript_24834/g.45388  ORF Transcript_24834/g.45388 Transcript_24834/m.45388 type:complete len:203 (-) Transcript_24834:483-1091(-)